MIHKIGFETFNIILNSLFVVLLSDEVVGVLKWIVLLVAIKMTSNHRIVKEFHFFHSNQGSVRIFNENIKKFREFYNV